MLTRPRKKIVIHDYVDKDDFVAKVRLVDRDAVQNAIGEMCHQKLIADDKNLELEMVLRVVGPKRQKGEISPKSD